MLKQMVNSTKNITICMIPHFGAEFLRKGRYGKMSNLNLFIFVVSYVDGSHMINRLLLSNGAASGTLLPKLSASVGLNGLLSQASVLRAALNRKAELLALLHREFLSDLLLRSGSLRNAASSSAYGTSVSETGLKDKSSVITSDSLNSPNFGNLLNFSVKVAADSDNIIHLSPIKVIHSGELPLRKGFVHFPSPFCAFRQGDVFIIPPHGISDGRPTRRTYGRGIFHIPSGGVPSWRPSAA